MAGFFAICAKPSKILFHFRVVWIIGGIDLMIPYHIADFIQRFPKTCEKRVVTVLELDC